MKKIFEKDKFWLFLVLLVSILAIFPLFRKGFYSFHDEAHFANLYEMVRAISSGQIPPRWAPDMSFNYGYPFFSFYYPLPYYFGAFFHLVFGLSLVWSLKLLFILSIPLSGIVFYFLARKFSGQFFSFTASFVYMFTPYRAVDLYVRGALGELWAFVFMPAVLLALVNLVERKRVKDFLFASLAVCLLIISHNLTPIIFLPAAFLLALILAFFSKKRSKGLVLISVSGLLGLALSAYYWLPAILEKSFVRQGTPFNPYDNFPFIKQLIIPSWGYGISQWGPQDGMSFQIGVVNLIIVILAATLLIIKRKGFDKQKKSLLIFILGMFLFFVFLMNIRSWFLWQLFPLGDYIQFPWRLLMMTTFLSSVLVIFLDKLFSQRKSAVIALFLVLSTIILNRQYFKPQNQVLSDDDYYLKKFFADRTSEGKSDSISEEYYNWSEDYLPLMNWIEKRPFAVPLKKLKIIDGHLEYKEVSPVYFQAEAVAEQDTKIFFYSYYYPGWQAWVDGKEEKLSVEKPYGNISIPLKKGGHTLKIRFTESPLRLLADLISLSSVIIILGCWFRNKRFEI